MPGTQPVAALARELAASARKVGLAWTVTDVRHRLDAGDLGGLLDDLLLAGTAGVLMAGGLLFIVAGGPFGEAMQQTYHWGGTAERVWDVLRWPLRNLST